MELSDPRHIHIKDYNYDLPDNKIAKYPLEERDNSKLLVYKDKTITDSRFSSIIDYLPDDSLMIFNNTKVIQARLHFNKSTGAQIEIFCLDPYSPHDYNLIFQATEECSWQCMIGNLKKWKEGILEKEVKIDNQTILLKAERIESAGNTHIIKFGWNNPQYTFADILDAVGELPIPPYLNRDTEEKDKETYQTLYSKIKGSVAAPTAGLHFTEKVFEKLREKGIETNEVTLHVGAGTFKPVKSEVINDHEMHSEFISVKRETIEHILSHKGNIIAVGTTSVRTLESLYHIGVALEKNPNLNTLKVEQWQPYSSSFDNSITKEKALKNILDYLDKHSINTLLADTQIMIVPGYTFKIVSGIVTNFHQPQSTLLLLVSAFVEGNWMSIYNHALAHEYRFLSYGDSSLLLR
ncbi:S-adenosylmethionine:tRNA ribosyltransferase-isomerase [Dysgonomonas sp. HGC4]|uniref:S-adenosylmethionine:tRNA ribosyltransferase-isomerase n=1 Tax=Dysgonomonas sp. HGC4 TaxID=1658009 RepID=UPI000682F38D|nr:S-adenosylmethionine:tRNA ribosyltransferase-isomerase [Dysgonomonas sp. HGC4]MBD8348759.1 S-adenosylmethionine:tRNA ribosyltransferase-isomerase [Dysgonomonas sp. HGC4]